MKSKQEARWMFHAAQAGQVPKEMPLRWMHETPDFAHLPEFAHHAEPHPGGMDDHPYNKFLKYLFH